MLLVAGGSGVSVGDAIAGWRGGFAAPVAQARYAATTWWGATAIRGGGDRATGFDAARR